MVTKALKALQGSENSITLIALQKLETDRKCRRDCEVGGRFNSTLRESIFGQPRKSKFVN